jgi:hypothetical protein
MNFINVIKKEQADEVYPSVPFFFTYGSRSQDLGFVSVDRDRDCFIVTDMEEGIVMGEYESIESILAGYDYGNPKPVKVDIVIK